jgi:hypothetical protein
MDIYTKEIIKRQQHLKAKLEEPKQKEEWLSSKVTRSRNLSFEIQQKLSSIKSKYFNDSNHS